MSQQREVEVVGERSCIKKGPRCCTKGKEEEEGDGKIRRTFATSNASSYAASQLTDAEGTSGAAGSRVATCSSVRGGAAIQGCARRVAITDVV